MGWFDWLRKAPAPVVDHPVFGRLRAAHRPKDGAWSWETLDLIETPRGLVSVNFDAGESGPGIAHEVQWRGILERLDELTRAAAPLVAGELQHWPVRFDPAAPWDELTWEGADLSGDSMPGNSFALAYGCKSWPDAMITVFFDNDRPIESRLDD